MQDVFGPKYYIDGQSFSIQYMHRKGYSVMPRPHVHPFYEIYYLLQGERVYFIDGKVYTAQRGEMIVINPNDLHSTASSDVQVFERILINFTDDFVQSSVKSCADSLLPFMQGSHLLRFSIKEQSEIEKLLREILEECKEEQDVHQAYVQALLTQLLIRIYRYSRQSVNEPPKYAHPMHEKISEIASYINQHYDQDLTLSQIAKQFFISPSYLSRIFAKLTGFHFREYLQVVRIREAQKRLKETKDKIQSIAELVGFEHISHFNKTFKKVTGISPLRYRKQSLATRTITRG